MIDPNPAYRTELEDILRSPWLNEVNNLTEEEDTIKEELEKIYIDKIKIQKIIKIEEYIKQNELITRSFTDDKNAIFKDKNLRPKKISKERFEINQSIRINGNFNEVDFMNSLAYKIRSEFKNSYIKAKENLRMEVTLEYGEEEEKDDEKEKINNIEDCFMMIELFEYEKGEYLLEFRRTGAKEK